MVSDNQNNGKWIHRVSQDDDLISLSNSEPVHRTHRRFKIKPPEVKSVDATDHRHESVIAARSERSGTYVGRIRKDTLPLRDSVEIGRMTGDWTKSVPGRVLLALLKIAVLIGLIWGGIYLWQHGPGTLFFGAIIVLLVWGVISAGMELGEASPYKQNATWASSIHFMWFHW